MIHPDNERPFGAVHEPNRTIELAASHASLASQAAAACDLIDEAATSVAQPRMLAKDSLAPAGGLREERRHDLSDYDRSRLVDPFVCAVVWPIRGPYRVIALIGPRE
jgi:hypothetical protein